MNHPVRPSSGSSSESPRAEPPPIGAGRSDPTADRRRDRHDERDPAPGVASSRRAARIFDVGNLVAVCAAGVPLWLAAPGVGVGTILAAIFGIVPLVLWFGASMLVYAFNSHHPHPLVRRYTQWAAYRYYALMGSLIVVGTFFPPDLDYYRGYWVFAAAIMIPWTLYALWRSTRENWSLASADRKQP